MSGYNGQNDDALQEHVLEVGLDARASVLKVGAGTGWVVDDGLAVTCSHVVEGEVVDVKTFDGQRQQGTIVDRDEDVDLAIIAIEIDNIEPLDLKTRTGAAGDPVVKVGHPDAVGTWIVSFGRVVQTRGGEILTDVPCGPGDSGSPLLALDGSAIGHVTGTTTLVDDPARLDRPETLVQNYEGQRHVSRAYRVEPVVEFLTESIPTANVDELDRSS